MIEFIVQYPWLEAISWLVILTIFALLINFVGRKLLIHGAKKLSPLLPKNTTTDIKNAIQYLANIISAFILSIGVNFIPTLPDAFSTVINNVANAFIIFFVVLTISSCLNIINILYEQRPTARLKPIKGYIQIAKIALFAIAAVLMVATLIDRSPLILFSGLGAMAAVLMLIFQDTLLSLVAGIQISSTDMVRVGDWIEIPNLGADGDVIEIALHTVKVQNFDNTITSVPIRKLVTDPFKNWRGMQESGGRRIKRSLFIDQSSIHFLTEEEQKYLSRFNLLENYFTQKRAEIDQWNAQLDRNRDVVANTRRLTNIGTFRAYVFAYLQQHLNINPNMTFMARQLPPTENGLPLEIYCFTNTTVWLDYEQIQGDIFDHLYSILHCFGLKVFQNPSGSDFNQAFKVKAK
ncbi:mechanosensitive ion channel family protein [Bartonella krasnovii]|uniref:Mechanosensitive ion channel family protein n=1 Tax=Bartonella krasnovii TaxID=2267275 RepID=A0A5B9D270_9HYPH|nr:mechanosensitive ion channel family protein [Bartonella krasnovii]QEE12497.1 mechanosensitive ion channel family protein [Bartonella krasnovii]UNF28590.1 mechanosensitive ion channel family protein [Bartonella krasnovii]UNF34968.1 mechanosensitive ion channel family protein [Bartonella krasnovii]UNF36605.1 mechanosensitive ion channel family protein [Bartonella krasnovii]UNF38238.1 mechanosensitive ion channel family protein [Bartonella krasnovii]